MAFWRHKCHKICLIHQLLTENRLERNLSFEWESCQSCSVLVVVVAHHLDIVTPSKEIYYYSLTKHFYFSHFVNVKVCGVSSLLFFVFFFFFAHLLWFDFLYLSLIYLNFLLQQTKEWCEIYFNEFVMYSVLFNWFACTSK